MLRKMLTSAGHLLRAHGIDIVRYPHPEHAHLRSALDKVFRALTINCVLDVGANCGQYGQFLRSMGFGGWIVSFEPVTCIREMFLEPAASVDGRWRVYPYALGSVDTVAPIHVTVGTEFSSFFAPDPVASGPWAHHNTVQHIESVPVKRLDAVLETCVAGIPDPRIYLKMDTQGYDAEVFTGAEGVLPRVRGLQTEVSLHPIYCGMPDAFTVLPMFMATGFALVDCIPVAREGLAAVEMDCIMVRRKR
jgi:FkbM family methyltransferase